MAWARLDDTYSDHPKVLEAWRRNPGAISVHVMSITYCARHRTDGRVPGAWLEITLPKPHERRKILDVLVETGLFDLRDGEYFVHDFLNYNGSREDDEVRRAAISQARSDAGRKGARKRWQTDGNAMATGDGKPAQVANGSNSSRPDPTRPDPKPPSPPRGNRTRDREAWEEEAVDWASAAGVTGPAPQVIKAVEQAAKWKRAETPAEFREFARQSFPSLNVVADLPDERDAA